MQIFVKKVTPGDIIVATRILDAGSSEHAPIAIKAAGVCCVIAETFARIFYRNAINIGLPIVECPEAAKDISDGDEVYVDFDSGLITNKTNVQDLSGAGVPAIHAKIIDCERDLSIISIKIKII